MNAQDLRTLVRSYNEREVEIFDQAAEIFVQQVRNELETIYNDGDWACMIGCTQLGITVESINGTFNLFRAHIIGVGRWILKEETLKETHGLMTFDEFIAQCDYENEELAGFQGKDIEQLKPFVEALNRKGFESYADYENGHLIVAFEV